MKLHRFKPMGTILWGKAMHGWPLDEPVGVQLLVLSKALDGWDPAVLFSGVVTLPEALAAFAGEGFGDTLQFEPPLNETQTHKGHQNIRLEFVATFMARLQHAPNMDVIII